MASQDLLLSTNDHRILESLIGQTIGGVASIFPSFRETWDASYELYIEVGDQVILMQASWAASADRRLATEIAQYSVERVNKSDCGQLSTWYHWWKGETIVEVLRVRDEIKIEYRDGHVSELLHDIGVILVCDVHSVAICLQQNLEFPGLIVGHELTQSGMLGIHTHPGATTLPWGWAEEVHHARTLEPLGLGRVA